MYQSLVPSLVACFFGWFLASSLWIYPHSLSYFNEAVGGPLEGSDHLLGSNLDWGQDLKYLNGCLAKSHEEYPEKISLIPLYVSSYIPADILSLAVKFEDLISRLPSVTKRSHGSASVSLFVSVNILKGSSWPLRNRNEHIGLSLERIRSLQYREPTAYAGYSLHEFQVSDGDF